MEKGQQKLFSERVTLRLILTALGIVVIGVLLLALSASEWLGNKSRVCQTVIQQLGGLLFVTAAITLIWEVFGKRAFLDEILAKAQVSRDVEFSGLMKVTDSFHTDIDWSRYIEHASKIDIFFAYGSTWRGSHDQELKRAAQRAEVRLRVVLPDPKDEQTVGELARRFGYTTEKLRSLVEEAANYFRSLRAASAGHGSEISVWFLPAAPTFTFYRFDHIGIIAMYTHRQERVGVPTFVFEQGGTLYDYMRKEFEAMIAGEGGLARRQED